MNSKTFDNHVYKNLEAIFQDENIFLSFLQTMGNNSTYNVENQLSIWEYAQGAIMCRTKLHWEQINRIVKNESLVIPMKYNEEVIPFYDFANTKSEGEDKYPRWEYEKEANTPIHENIKEFSANWVENNLSPKWQQVGNENIKKFIKECVGKAVCVRLNENIGLFLNFYDSNEFTETFAKISNMPNAIKLGLIRDISNNVNTATKYVYDNKMKFIEPLDKLYNEFYYNKKNDERLNNDEYQKLGRNDSGYISESRRGHIPKRGREGADSRQSSEVNGGGDARGFDERDRGYNLGRNVGDNGQYRRHSENATELHNLISNKTAFSASEGALLRKSKVQQTTNTHTQSTDELLRNAENHIQSNAKTAEHTGVRGENDGGAEERKQHDFSNGNRSSNKAGDRDRLETMQDVEQITLNAYLEEKEKNALIDEPRPIAKMATSELKKEKPEKVSSFYSEAQPTQSDYWIVEFNESSNLIRTSYKGRIVNKELIDEIKELDKQIKLHNEIVGINEWEGYSKFYFDHIENGEVTEHLRVDIGDGNEVNGRYFQYLYEKVDKEYEISNFEESSPLKEEDRAELLHHSLDVVNDQGTVIANQFIVDVDNQNRELTVYSEKNPNNYREFKLSFDYLNGLGKIDGDGNNLKLTKHQKETIDKKLESYDNWRANRGLEATERETPTKEDIPILNDEYMGGIPPVNYKITKEDEILPPSERLRNNISAIKLLKEIEERPSYATKEEQDILSKYVGWGGLSDVFDETKEGQWKEAREFLKENLSSSEYEAARESTLTSFYTPKTVIDGIYKTLSGMGFKNGNILEPSMGIGNFIGNVPDEMSKSKFYGVELDSVSGRIGKLLYPESEVQVKGLEETGFSNNFFDLAIGNVPFGDFSVYDNDYLENKFLIHDYFFAKTLDKVRSEGVIAFITSSGTMDKKDESVRRYLAARAEFLGAIRLPNDTFKGIAGTEVTSDIIFLKKRDSIIERDDDWIHLAEDERGLTYNQYFVDHPEQVLGSMEEVSGRFGNTLACLPKENTDLKELLKRAGREISKAAKYEKIDIKEKTAQNTLDNFESFTFFTNGEDVFYKDTETANKIKAKGQNIGIITQYIKLREVLRQLIRLESGNYKDYKIISKRNELNHIYDEFYKKYGGINDDNTIKLIRDDNYFPLVSSIEKVEVGSDNKKKFSKAEIFTKRIISPNNIVTSVETSQDALKISISEKGKVDIGYICKLTGKDRESTLADLKDEIFVELNGNKKKLENQISSKTETYVIASEYLSGNIKEKIEKAESLIKSDNLRLRTICDYQIEKLKEVLPTPLTPYEISAKLGSPWIPSEYIEDFIRYKLSIGASVIHVEQTGNWEILDKSSYKFHLSNTKTYGTERVSALNLIELALNLKTPKVYDTIDDKRVINQKETLLAIEKQALLKENFKEWTKSDIKVSTALAKIYNDKFNCIKNRDYDGSLLKLPNINEDIKLRTHQKNAIARAIYGGNSLFAHAVGAGKTYELITVAMEGKRLGLHNKSLIVVPNHLTGQFGRDFLKLYPTAHVMIASKEDFTKEKRKLFVSKIATQEYDAIIISQSQFERIPMSDDFQRTFIREQIEAIDAYLNNISKYSNSYRSSVKNLEAAKKRLRVNLDKLIRQGNKKKDYVLHFEELGVDKLFVDEAHNYKNLFFYTKTSGIAGIAQTHSQKSQDMFLKTRFLDKKTNNRGVVFATGTPVSNSMAELYTMQRYLQFDELKKRNFDNFDAWLGTFGVVEDCFELAPEGTGYRQKTRVTKFDGLPELMALYREIADIQTPDMLNLPTPKANYHIVETEATETQKKIVQSFAKRADLIRMGSVDPKEDNMLKITREGKELAIDQRIINQLLPDDKNSKVNKLVENVYNIWERSKENRSTQLIFSDTSVPNKDRFSIYDDIKAKLIRKGVPKAEIAFIHDANNDRQKMTLFDNVQSGKIRILLGSTSKMGTGANIQKKLIALHDLDVPWRPSDLIQREGRIVRQGNENSEVDVFRYVTKGTFDSYLWQIIENKQKMISQVFTSKAPARVIEGIDETVLSFAEIKALATSNPLIRDKMTLENAITKLEMLKSNYESSLIEYEEKVKITYPREIKQYKKIIHALKNDIKNTKPKVDSEGNFIGITIRGTKYTDKTQAGNMLIELVKKAEKSDLSEVYIGQYRGFEVSAEYNLIENAFNIILRGEGKHIGVLGNNGEGNIRRMDNVIEKIPDTINSFETKLNNTKYNLQNAQDMLDKPFEKEKELQDKKAELVKINFTLNAYDKSSEEVVDENIGHKTIKKADGMTI